MAFRIGETFISCLHIDKSEIDLNEGCNSTILFSLDSESSVHRGIFKTEVDSTICTQKLSMGHPENIEVDLQDFVASSDEDACSQLSGLFSSLKINPEDKQKLGQRIVRHTYINPALLKPSSPNLKRLVKIQIVLITKYRWTDTIPASSMSNLVKGRLSEVAAGREDCDMNCAICLDEFKASSMVTQMPCSHVFHGRCIDEWLQKSHYCPLCRFEMPTDEIPF